MSRQKRYSKRKRSAREKRRLFYGAFIASIFLVSILVAVYFVLIVGVG